MKSCIKCGTSEASGWVSGPTCKRCYMKEYNQRKHRKQAQAERGRRPDVIEKHNEWVRNNPSKVHSYKQKYRNNNPDKVKATKKAYHNSESYKNVKKRWSDDNRPIINSLAAKRRASKLKATPKWLTKKQRDEIREFYKIAKELENITGIKHHVDHIYPLQGENSCGLHVPWNLQVLTASENISKGNKVGRVT